jgi:hypothetical protein
MVILTIFFIILLAFIRLSLFCAVILIDLMIMGCLYVSGVSCDKLLFLLVTLNSGKCENCVSVGVEGGDSGNFRFSFDMGNYIFNSGNVV